MERFTLKGNPPVDVWLRRSARARRLSLRVSRIDGDVSLTMPPRAPLRDALEFLKDREDWLRGHLDGIQPVPTLADGALVPFEGRELPVVVTPARGRARIAADRIEVAAGRPVGAQVKALLKVAARERLVAASDRYAAALAHPYSRITLRDTRSRWGSCAPSGALSYSWRLVMAPPAVLDYVAAHEVAHLEQANHSPAFWAVVARLCPDYAAHRAWLRTDGGALLRYDFGD